MCGPLMTCSVGLINHRACSICLPIRDSTAGASIVHPSPLLQDISSLTKAVLFSPCLFSHHTPSINHYLYPTLTQTTNPPTDSGSQPEEGTTKNGLPPLHHQQKLLVLVPPPMAPPPPARHPLCRGVPPLDIRLLRAAAVARVLPCLPRPLPACPPRILKRSWRGR